jgi:hypothetical protein
MASVTQDQVEINGATVLIKDTGGEEVRVSPWGVHVKDGESDVKVSWAGINIRDGNDKVNISTWKVLAVCALVCLVFVGVVAAVAAGVVALII